MRRVLARLLIPVSIVLVAGLAVTVLGLDGVGGIDGVPRVESPVAVGAAAEPPPACEQYVPFQVTPPDVGRPPGKPPPGKLTAVVSTNCGEIEIALDSRRFPRTVASFVHLARRGAYDGTDVHRVIRGQLVQGGDPTGTGSGGAGYSIRERPPSGTRYPRGTVAMARAEGDPPGTSSSQFFIVTAADAGLRPEYAVLGRVTAGFDVVRTIDALGDPTGATEQPAQTVPIVKITIRRAR